MISTYETTPKQLKDTTVGIWDYLYYVRVPYLATMSVEYLREYGIPSSGDANIDREQANQLLSTYLSIAKLVDYHKEGVPIRVVNREDVKRIYDAISDHLNAWKEQLTQGINIGDAPIEDLLAMDRFANDIYGHVKYELINRETESNFVKAISKFGFFSKKNSLVKPPVNRSMPFSGNMNDLRYPTSNEPVLPERDSMSEMLKKSLAKSGRFN